MSAKSDYLENAILNHVLRNVAMPSPTTVLCGLFTAAPTEDGVFPDYGGFEVPGANYVRVPVTFGAPSGGSVANTNTVSFPMASANWGEIVAFGLFDMVTGGNMLYYGMLTVSKVVSTNDVLEFAPGALVVSEL